MTSAEYTFQDGFKVTNEMLKDYDEFGYIMVRKLLSTEEIQLIEKALTDGDFMKYAYDLPDDEGKDARIVLWNHPGNDVTGMVGRCEKVAGTCEKLMGGEVYHYHTKMFWKQPKIGGKVLWHQDYGYWYKNGCLFPKMMTAFIAIDRCHKANGCLQVLSGSHKCGRVEHVANAAQEKTGQQEVDPERLKEIKKVCPLQYMEMEPGDALFFGCNLIHCSGNNQSDDRRWAFLCAYNSADNDPVIDHFHPHYTPLEKVPDKAILTCTSHSLEGKDFMDFGKIDKEKFGFSGKAVGQEESN